MMGEEARRAFASGMSESSGGLGVSLSLPESDRDRRCGVVVFGVCRMVARAVAGRSGEIVEGIWVFDRSGFVLLDGSLGR